MSYIKKIVKYGGVNELLSRMAAVVFLLLLTGALDAVGIPLLIPIVEGIFGTGETDSGMTVKMREALASLGLSKNLNMLMAVVVGLIIFSFALKFINTVQMERIRNHVTRRFREGLIKALYGTRWSAVLCLRSGEFSNIVIEKCPYAGDLFFFTLKGSAALFYSIVYVGVAVYISWHLSLVFFLCLFIVFIVNMFLSILARKYNRMNLKFSNLLSADLMDRLRAMKFIFSSNLQNKTFQFLSNTNKLSLKSDYKYRTTTQLSAYFNEVAGILVLIVIYLISKNIAFGIAELIVFLYILRQLMPRVNDILKAQQIWMAHKPNMLLIIGVIENFVQKKGVEGKVEITEIENIKFDNVCFKYDASLPIFENLSFAVQKNKMTALVGVSGTGKTTIADLIVGLMEPQRGGISINGHSMPEIDRAKLHELIGYVSQDSVLFNGTIRENVCIRKENATRQEMDRVFSIVALDEFIKTLPHGYETEIGENGIKLSGGQRQRIALARALIISPQLLILDEATSSLDVESEAAIQSALEYMRKKLTIIVIAHRLSTVKSADIIHVIEGRRIVESGGYEELVRLKGRLYRFDQAAGIRNSVEED